MRFIEEIKQSKAFKFTASYLGICFVALQILDPLSERNIINDELFKIFVYLLVAGTPIPLAIGFLSDRYRRKLIGKKTNFNFNVVISFIALFTIFYLSITNIGLKQSSEKLNWARQDAIPRLYQLIQDGKSADAYKLGKEIEFIIPEDPMLVRAFAKISRKVAIFSEPIGAEVYRKDYNSDDSTFEYLGTTPVKDIRFPYVYSLLKLEKDSFETIKIGTHPY